MTKRKYRDIIRKVIPECIFINLVLSPETQNQRLENRYAHFSTEKRVITKCKLRQILDGFELAGKDEENVVDVVPFLNILAEVKTLFFFSTFYPTLISFLARCFSNSCYLSFKFTFFLEPDFCSSSWSYQCLNLGVVYLFIVSSFLLSLFVVPSWLCWFDRPCWYQRQSS